MLLNNNVLVRRVYERSTEDGCGFYTTDEHLEDGRPLPDAWRAIKIVYHFPEMPGDLHYCDIYKLDGTVARLFDLGEVVFEGTFQ